jgi:MFS family permease
MAEQIYGYPAPKTAIGWNISPVRQQLISSLMTLGAFLSSGGAGVVAKTLGRRQCLWLASLLCCIANIIMMATTHIAALYVGRLIIGIANGYFMAFSQLYIQESSPSKYRGLFLSCFQFFTSFVCMHLFLDIPQIKAHYHQGTLIGTIVDYSTAKRAGKSAYLIPLAVVYVVPAVMTVAMFFIPESPRWLILQGRHEEGRKALAWLRPSGTNVDLEAEVIQENIRKEREIGSEVGVLDMFKNPVDRRRTILAVCAVTLQAASGSMFIIGMSITNLIMGQLLIVSIAFKAYFFAMGRVSDPFAMSCVLSAVGLLAIVINSLIVVRYGRRRVLLTTRLIICGFLQLIIAVVYDKKGANTTTGKVLVALSCLYMMSYNVSHGDLYLRLFDIVTD